MSSWNTQGSAYSGTANGDPLGDGEPSLDIKDRARQATGDALNQAGDKAVQVTDQVKQQAASRLGEQKDRAAQGLGGVADALRQVGQQLQQDQAPVARYFDQAAGQVDNVANYLQTRDVGEMVREVERFARREPALFLGGAFALGLLTARFLKSSAQALPQQTSGYGAGADYGQYGDYRGYGSTAGSLGTAYSGGAGSTYGGATGRGYAGSAGRVRETLPLTIPSDLTPDRSGAAATGGYGTTPGSAATGGYSATPGGGVAGGYSTMPSSAATGDYSTTPGSTATGGYSATPGSATGLPDDSEV